MTFAKNWVEAVGNNYHTLPDDGACCEWKTEEHYWHLGVRYPEESIWRFEDGSLVRICWHYVEEIWEDTLQRLLESEDVVLTSYIPI